MVERCYVAASLDEALKIRKETGAHVLAGGTDLMVQFRQGTGISPVFPFPVVIISSVRELDDITAGDDGTVTIGALAVPARIAASQLVPLPTGDSAVAQGRLLLFIGEYAYCKTSRLGNELSSQVLGTHSHHQSGRIAGDLTCPGGCHQVVLLWGMDSQNIHSVGDSGHSILDSCERLHPFFLLN